MNVGEASAQDLFQLMNKSRTVAIVGASDNPSRASHAVSQYLASSSHYKLFFVNPRLETLLGQTVYPSLVDIPEHIDIVDVFRKAEDCLGILDEAIAIGASAIWLQLGISVPEVKEKGLAAGLTVVMDRCLKVDYQARYPEFDAQRN